MAPRCSPTSEDEEEEVPLRSAYSVRCTRVPKFAQGSCHERKRCDAWQDTVVLLVLISTALA